MARIFVSHSSRDNELAGRLFAWLRAQGFEQTFLDFDKHSGIQPGAEWERTLYREIERSQAVLVVHTKHWLDSKWCFAEYAQARALGKAIFPLIETPSGELLIGSDLQTIDLRSDRENGLDRLSRALTEVALQSADGFTLPRGEPPFPGLNAFEEKHAAIFYGRDDVLIRLIETLRRRRVRGGERLIALLGASGSGKSSLLRAGLVARLKRDRANWIVLPPFRPEFDPARKLIDALLLQVEDLQQVAAWETRLTGDAPAQALADVARYLRRRAGSLEAQILIPIDQGEELFTTASRESVDRFFSLLSLMLSGPLPFMAVAALRSDHLGNLQVAPSLSVPFEAFPLEPMPLDRIGLLIRGPARIAGIKVDEALVTAITHDAATADALPLIAFTLRELYERHGRDGDLTLAEYESLGDRAAGLNPLENAIRLTAEEALPRTKRSEEDERLVREAFVPGLVRVNADGRFVRRPAEWDELPKASQPFIERLIEARLLVRRMGTSRGGEKAGSIVEVAHEALFRVWPDLAAWLEEERDFLIGKSRLEAAFKDWQALSKEARQKGFLSGVLLDRAQTWLLNYPTRLTEDERTFILASANCETARLSELQESRRSLSGFLADLSAQRIIEGRIGEAVALARLAVPVEMSDWPRVKSAEHSLSLATQAYRTALGRPIVGFIGHEGTVRGAVFSPDLNRILTWSFDGTARLWDAKSGNQTAVLRHNASVRGSRFSSDGCKVLTWSSDGTARIWDVTSGEQIGLCSHDDVIGGAIFSSDESRVLTWAYDGKACVWDARNGSLLAKLSHNNVVKGALFANRGQFVLTWAHDHTAAIWNAADGDRLIHMKHEDDVRGVKLLASESRVLTWSADKSVRLWDALSGEELLQLSHESEVRGVLILADEKKVVTWAGRSIQVWDLMNGQQLIQFHQDAKVIGVSLSVDESKALTWCVDGTVSVWDLINGEQLGRQNHKDVVLGARFSPDETHVLSWSYDHTAKLWLIQTGDSDKDNSPYEMNHDGVVREAIFTPNGEWIWTRSDDGTVRLWPRGPGYRPAILRHQGEVLGWSSTKDGRLLTASADGTARLWEVSPEKLSTRVFHEGRICGGMFSRGGCSLLTWSSDNTVRLWDTEDGRQLLLLSHENDVLGATFSGNGKLILAWTAGGTVRLWGASSGIPLARMECLGTVENAMFSPAGNRVFASWGDGRGGIFDVYNGNQIGELRHDGCILGVMFSSDSYHLLSWSRDGTARVWNSSTGEEVHRFRHDRLVGATLSSDMCRVLTWSDGTNACLWDLVAGAELARLPHDTDILGAVFSVNGDRVLSWEDYNAARVWDSHNGKELVVLRHPGSVDGGFFVGEGKVLTWSNDGTVRLWDAEKGSLLLELLHDAPVRSVVVCDAGNLLFTASGSEAFLWDFASGDLVASIKDAGRHLLISPHGRLLATWSNGSSVQLWPMWCPLDTAALHASQVIEHLRPLSRQDRRSALNGDHAHLRQGARPMMSAPKNFDRVVTHRQLADQMKVDLVVDAYGEPHVFHTLSFGRRLKRIEIVLVERKIYFVTDINFVRSFGASIPQHLLKLLENVDRIMMVQMDEATGKPIAGDYYPVLIY